MFNVPKNKVNAIDKIYVCIKLYTTMNFMILDLYLSSKQTLTKSVCLCNDCVPLNCEIFNVLKFVIIMYPFAKFLLLF